MYFSPAGDHGPTWLLSMDPLGDYKIANLFLYANMTGFNLLWSFSSHELHRLSVLPPGPAQQFSLSDELKVHLPVKLFEGCEWATNTMPVLLH